MQMKTRSTTRAEAARLKKSTRTKSKAAMAPPLSKFNARAPQEQDYKLPRQKERVVNARMHGPSPSMSANRNLAS